MPAATAAFTSAGTQLFVCATAATGNPTSAAFAAMTWVEVGEITNFGEFGREYQAIRHNAVSKRKTEKRKGTYDDGALALTMARVPGDAGHVILDTFLDSDDSMPVKIELGDGTTQYFLAQVMSYKTNIGDGNSITAASTSLEITSDIVEVAPV